MADFLVVSLGLAAISSLLWVTMPSAFLPLVVQRCDMRLKRWLGVSQKTLFVSTVWFTFNAIVSVTTSSNQLLPPTSQVLTVTFGFGAISLVIGLVFAYLVTDSLLGEEAKRYRIFGSVVDLGLMTWLSVAAGVSAIQFWFGIPFVFALDNWIQRVYVGFSPISLVASVILLFTYRDGSRHRIAFVAGVLTLVTPIVWIYWVWIHGGLFA